MHDHFPSFIELTVLFQEADNEVLAFRNKQGAWVNKSGVKEVIPDWFYERNKKDSEPKLRAETATMKKEREDVDRLIAIYANG